MWRFMFDLVSEEICLFCVTILLLVTSCCLFHEGGASSTSGICPRGFYCPNGTKAGTEYGCPNGTYNDVEGLYEEAQCKNCWQGENSHLTRSPKTLNHCWISLIL